MQGPEVMSSSRERTDFSKIATKVQIPNLIDVQKQSYERFLQNRFRETFGFLGTPIRIVARARRPARRSRIRAELDERCAARVPTQGTRA